MAANQCKYSCDTAAETLDWIKAIVDFIKPFSSLINAHVVNFFEDQLWEAVDEDWLHCLSNEPVENLLLIPSGSFQDHWPISLKEFVRTLNSLVYPRQQADLKKVFPDFHMTSLNSVLAQGMNVKKKHEVEVLSAIVSSVASSVRADAVIDVGAGQGYLAQVLAFEYQHSVIAIDACSHHVNVTNARAERIKKYYMAQMRKFGQWEFLGSRWPSCLRRSLCNNAQVLHKYFPEAGTSPSIGRQGKASRRKQQRKIIESELHSEESKSDLPQKAYLMGEACSIARTDSSGVKLDVDALFNKMSLNTDSRCQGTMSADKYSLFEKYCESGLSRLGLKPTDDINFHGIWKEVEPYVNLIGVYWSLRAAFGPLLETVILLDRLLFLQEQGGELEAVMLPIFDPTLSPRNVAIIARRPYAGAAASCHSSR